MESRALSFSSFFPSFLAWCVKELRLGQGTNPIQPWLGFALGDLKDPVSCADTDREESTTGNALLDVLHICFATGLLETLSKKLHLSLTCLKSDEGHSGIMSWAHEAHWGE